MRQIRRKLFVHLFAREAVSDRVVGVRKSSYVVVTNWCFIIEDSFVFQLLLNVISKAIWWECVHLVSRA